METYDNVWELWIWWTTCGWVIGGVIHVVGYWSAFVVKWVEEFVK